MEEKEIIQSDLPYTIVGHTTIPVPQLSILLTAKGIKELAKRTIDKDLVRIEVWEDCTNMCKSKKYYNKITIVK